MARRGTIPLLLLLLLLLGAAPPLAAQYNQPPERGGRIYALGMPPFDDLGAIEINPSVSFSIIDRMLGGSGQAITATRALTEIEQNVVDSLVKLLLEGLAEAWKPVTDLTFTIRGRETRPQMLQVAAPNEIYARPEGRVVGGLIGQGSILPLPVGAGRERSLDRAACHALLLGEAGGDLRDVLIRPEHVRPAADGIALQVRDCVFTGERHALTLARADGTLLKAYSAERLAPGSMAVFSVERGWRL